MIDDLSINLFINSSFHGANDSIIGALVRSSMPDDQVIDPQILK